MLKCTILEDLAHCGLVDIKLDSRSKGRGFKSHPILDGNGVKTMPGRLKYPILVHSLIEKKENTGGQMGLNQKQNI